MRLETKISRSKQRKKFLAIDFSKDFFLMIPKHRKQIQK